MSNIPLASNIREAYVIAAKDNTKKAVASAIEALCFGITEKIATGKSMHVYVFMGDYGLNYGVAKCAAKTVRKEFKQRGWVVNQHGMNKAHVRLELPKKRKITTDVMIDLL